MQNDYSNITNEQVEEFIPYVRSHIRAEYPKFRDPDDLFSAGLEGLLEGIRRFDPAKGASYRAWVRRYIRFFIRNRKQELSGRAFQCHADPARLANLPSSEPGPLDSLIRDERLKIAVSVLDDFEQRVVHYIYFQDLKPAEIARKFGVFPSTVTRAHQRALKKMRRALGVRL